MPFDGTTNKCDKVIQLLFYTKEEIERRGWCQWTLQDAEGRVCLMGGVKAASYDSQLWDGIDADVYKAIKRTIGGVELASYNDEEGRTIEEIIAVIDRTIEQVALGS